MIREESRLRLGKRVTDAEIVADRAVDRRRVSQRKVWLVTWKAKKEGANGWAPCWVTGGWVTFVNKQVINAGYAHRWTDNSGGRETSFRKEGYQR